MLAIFTIDAIKEMPGYVQQHINYVEGKVDLNAWEKELLVLLRVIKDQYAQIIDTKYTNKNMGEK